MLLIRATEGKPVPLAAGGQTRSNRGNLGVTVGGGEEKGREKPNTTATIATLPMKFVLLRITEHW